MSTKPRKLFLLLAVVTGLTACPRSDVDAPDQRGFLDRHQDRFVLRVMSWNVKFGSVVPADGRRHESFPRILRAVYPDVICLQEVAPSELEMLAQMVDDNLPLDENHFWHVHHFSDNAIFSRFPLLRREQEAAVSNPYPELGFPDFHYGQAMALIDVPDELSDVDVYVIAMHNRSRAGEERVRKRQVQSDTIVRWIRNQREGNALSENTPIIILGDMNVIPSDPARHLSTLLTGNIADEETYGPDFKPDWDSTDLTDALPSHNALGKEFYTCRLDDGSFPPGALSRILYTDSVLSLKLSLVLNTTSMNSEALRKYGLQETDVLLGGKAGSFDHLPLVADFAIR